jgi:DMATS type aromatic prenyltransferase
MKRTKTWAQVDVEHPLTYRNVVATHLKLLRETVAPADEAAAQQLELVCSLPGAWADEPIERFDRYHSFVANDGSPVEFSVAMTRSGAQARLLFEPVDSTPGPPSPWREGRRFVERSSEVLHLDVSRFHLVADLFDGMPPIGSFSMMCAAALTTRDPLVKVYLNPAIGPMQPHHVVGAALERLGLNTQWRLLSECLGVDTFGSPHHEIALFALDLGTFPGARVKVYLRHTGCGPDQIERVAALAPDYQPGLFAKILGQIYDDPVESLAKAPMTCLSFLEDSPEPASVTLYCPLDPNIGNDAQAGARVTDLLEMSGIAPETFKSAATVISGPDPADGHRLSWVSYKRPADPVVTVYAGLDGSARDSA